jgi:hypothetical protein
LLARIRQKRGIFLGALRRATGRVGIFAAEIRLLFFPSFANGRLHGGHVSSRKKGDMLATLMAYGSAPVHSGWHNCRKRDRAGSDGNMEHR